MKRHKIMFESRVEEINKKIEETNEEVTMLTEKATTYRGSTDKVLNDQINEFMEEISLLKNKKQEYMDDIGKLQHQFQKDIKKRQTSLHDYSQKRNRRKSFIRKVIFKIIQNNDKVTVLVHINSFLLFHLNNEIIHKVEVERNALASKYRFKNLKKFMED